MQAEISQSEQRRSHRRKLPIKLHSLVPYRLGLWIIWQMSRSWLLQRTVFRRTVRRLEPTLALAAQPIDHNRAVRRHLVGVAYKFTRKWRRLAAERVEGQQLRDLFPITGFD
jgi:hypothetical protein